MTRIILTTLIFINAAAAGDQSTSVDEASISLARMEKIAKADIICREFGFGSTNLLKCVEFLMENQ